MTRPLLAAFADPATLRTALRSVRESGFRPLDAFTPFPVEGMAPELDPGRSSIRWWMLAAALLVGAAAYALEWWSAVHAYPIDSGGRPLHSWPVFLLAPFEVAVLAGAVAGLVAFLRDAGLPALHHPLFEIPSFERASDDRFFLLAAADGGDEEIVRLRRLLELTGALDVTEVRGR